MLCVAMLGNNEPVLFTHDVLLDIDECSTGVHNCTQNQQCVNRPGDYECECVSGYELVNEICQGNEAIVSIKTINH